MIKLLFTVLLLCVWSGVNAADTTDAMLEAYGNGNYSKARQLAKANPDNSQSRLITALIQVFDPVSPDIHGGLVALEKLYRDKSLPLSVWAEAALSYGRIAQLVQARKEVYGDLATGIDSSNIFQAVIARLPNTRASCTALLFMLIAEFALPDQNKIKTAFARLEKFCRNFKGKPECLIPLHLLAEQQYIILKHDFTSAAEHLKAAYKLGIANPRDTEIVLFRIGRIYDLKLHDRKKATIYYQKFLAAYPDSGYAPMVKRFMKAASGHKTRSKCEKK